MLAHQGIPQRKKPGRTGPASFAVGVIGIAFAAQAHHATQPWEMALNAAITAACEARACDAAGLTCFNTTIRHRCLPAVT